uniref:Uncharacterized protein n=1 Tax=Anguilla anguilla TaxID=7936 RepID=A0A0E9P8B8_ANGAN
MTKETYHTITPKHFSKTLSVQISLVRVVVGPT